ncbi:hypothetical protein HPP92_017098 [Vanilla planifolia]|uniref:Uncharacterized protein n=1 Tax=Vanilla planifolia TaxID=51239 RepID=A0A835UPB0_VANPL|nr:hypothetical protein HPP92_017098 [Vanilla planifolia]
MTVIRRNVKRTNGRRLPSRASRDTGLGFQGGRDPPLLRSYLGTKGQRLIVIRQPYTLQQAPRINMKRVPQN